MYHHVPHAIGDTLLFRDWTEALALWRCLVRVPGLLAACVMPTHAHLLTSCGERAPVRHAMGSYTQWRRHHRGALGTVVWRPLEPPKGLATRAKIRRDERYVHLNPCRAHLVRDPLEWPLSTHRDAVGLAIPLCRDAAHRPARYHRHVSGDPSVDVQGTALPRAQLLPTSEEALPLLWQAVAGLTRSTDGALRRRGAPRRLFLQAARVLTDARPSQIAAFAGVTRRSISRAPAEMTREVRLVQRVAGDGRFKPVDDIDLAVAFRFRRRRT